MDVYAAKQDEHGRAAGNPFALACLHWETKSVDIYLSRWQPIQAHHPPEIIDDCLLL